MTEETTARRHTTRYRVIPERELLDESEGLPKELEHAETYAQRACKAGNELAKMGPVLSAFGEKIRQIGDHVKEAVAYRWGRAYYEVRLYAPRVRATSEREAARILGEEASLSSRWEPCLEIDEEIERIPWTEEI